MPLTARAAAVLISASNPFLAGAATLLSEDPTIAEDGWDTLALSYAIRRPTLPAETLISLFPHGAQLGPENWYDLGLPGPVATWPADQAGTRHWWVVAARAAPIARGIWRAEISLKGIAGPRPYKIRFGAAAKTSSAKALTASGGADYRLPPVGTYPKLATAVSEPTISVTYLSPHLGYDALALVGHSPTAPPLDGLPTMLDIWTGLADSVFHWPNGWVLTASEQDRLIGCSAALVTDTFKYTPTNSPG